MYTELDNIDSEEGIQNFATALEDRFGPRPQVVDELFEGLRMRWLAKSLGFDRVTLKNDVLRCYFHKNAQSAYYESAVFDKLIKLLGTNGRALGIQLKQSVKRLLLIKEKIKSMTSAREFLTSLQTMTEDEIAKG